MTDDILKRLAGASCVIGNAPELPGFNGSVLTIDDVEAVRCAADIDAGIAEIERLRAAALGVVVHMEGRMPVRGWLNDNDKSRAALAELVRALGA